VLAWRGNMKSNLFRLCLGYFFAYVLTGLSVKYFTGSVAKGFVGQNDVEYLLYSTSSASLLCVAVVLVFSWQKRMQPFSWRSALPILLSGVCTAFIIPSTTLLYAQPISVMIAMVLMRAGVLIASRLVDQLLLWQKLTTKKVTWEENLAVFFALLSMSLQAGASFFKGEEMSKHFAFLESRAVMGLLFFYLLSYFIRIYIMNYFKSTDPGGTRVDNKGFFGIEQLAASGTMLLAASCLLLYASQNGADPQAFSGKLFLALQQAHEAWPLASLSGLSYGLVAFFSVFIFMVRGRSATFAGLANRLTSLLAGTASTLIGCVLFASPWPSLVDWGSFFLIMFAVLLLARAELRHTKA
jgi:hypothetical protein